MKKNKINNNDDDDDERLLFKMFYVLKKLKECRKVDLIKNK